MGSWDKFSWIQFPFPIQKHVSNTLPRPQAFMLQLGVSCGDMLTNNTGRKTDKMKQLVLTQGFL